MKNFNKWLATRIVALVGTMGCAYLFAAFTLPALPQVVHDTMAGNYLSPVQWLTQTFIQLVLLPVIMVGQSLQNSKLDDMHEVVKEHHGLITDAHRMLSVLHHHHVSNEEKQ